MSRPSTSFQKRQRELAKREKRKHKDEKREHRKVQSAESGGAPIEVIDPADLGLPELDSIRSEENQLPADIRSKFSPKKDEEEQETDV